MVIPFIQANNNAEFHATEATRIVAAAAAGETATYEAAQAHALASLAWSAIASNRETRVRNRTDKG